MFSSIFRALPFRQQYLIMWLACCFKRYWYIRVTCKRRGGFRFTINGGSYFEPVLISNVGGAGDQISKAWIKGSKSNKWEAMTRNWGANWQGLSYLNGQSLSFKLQTSDWKIVTALNVVPSNWAFGQSFRSNVQIHAQVPKFLTMCQFSFAICLRPRLFVGNYSLFESEFQLKKQSEKKNGTLRVQLWRIMANQHCHIICAATQVFLRVHASVP